MVAGRKQKENSSTPRYNGSKTARNFLKRETFFKDVIDSIQDGISILDTELNILFVNKAMKKWYSHRLPLVGTKCYTSYHGRTSPCEPCPSVRTLKTGRPEFDVVPLTGPEGTTGWLQLFTFPLKNSKIGRLIGVIEYVRDISEIKRAEESLRDSEERFRSLAQTAVDAIISTDSSGDIIFWNKGAEAVFGYPEEEMLQKPLTILVPERYKTAIQEGLDEVRSTRKTGYFGKTTELYGLKKDANEFPLELSVASWDTDKGTFATAIIRDISKRKHMEEELRSLSLVDELTALYNRRGFLTLANQQFKIAERLERGLYLLFADMDGLKDINDTYGHQEGNMALIDTSNILKETFRESDIIARIGGDEFVVMAMETADTDPDVFDFRLQEEIRSFNVEGNRRYTLSISMGIARYDPASPCSLDDLLEKADQLMYEQKRSKKRVLQRKKEITS